MKKRDLVGQLFGNYLVIGEVISRPRYVLCRCSCGNEREVFKSSLTTGKTKSCGCIGREATSKANTTHGLCKKDRRFYSIHRNMMSRCYNEKNKRFESYGGSGIRVYKEWHDLIKFYEDMYSSYLECMEITDGRASIERISNTLGYYPDNCKWIDSRDQVFHRGLQKRNKTGVVGVEFQENRNRYVSTIKEFGTGKATKKTFLVTKYASKEHAFAEAVAWRKAQISIQNSNGAKYVQEELNG